MKSIRAYDIEANILEQVADENDTTEAEILEILCEYIEQAMSENGMKCNLLRR